MSRVFVSCSVRDRAAGEELGRIIRALGHEPLDDVDASRGTVWWNEAVGRIEASDVFLAVASPSYGEAHSCRLAAKHAAASGLPVVRVDLGGVPVSDCHPAVAEAVAVPFAPHDPQTVARLAQALAESADDPAPDPQVRPGPATASAAEEHSPGPPPAVPVEREGSVGRFSRLEVVVAAFMLLAAAVLLSVGLRNRADPAPHHPGSTAIPGETSRTPAPSADEPGSTGGAGNVPGDAPVAVLADITSVGSDLLPASACRAGADAVTCAQPAPAVDSAVLRSYATPAALYDAYAAAVEGLSGRPGVENTGNCSMSESEGEVGWNLDKSHTLAFPVAEQERGGLDAETESAGRVFCTVSDGVMQLMWTQDPDLLVTVAGDSPKAVVDWWSKVHLRLACPRAAGGSGCAAGAL